MNDRPSLPVLFFVLLAQLGAAGVCCAKESAPQSGVKPAATQVHASFDCAKAVSQVEKMICSSEKLAALDVKLSQAYGKARSANPDQSAAIKKEQLAWLKKRNACQDAACVERECSARVVLLEASAAKLDPSLNLTGDYDSGENSLTLTHQPGGKTVKFELMAFWHGAFEGQIHEGSAAGEARLRGRIAIYQTEECFIMMEFKGQEIEVNQDLDRGDCGFGMNVIADGTYKRVKK